LNKSNAAGTAPINVHEALEAICAHGKGRCWHCDARLPSVARAIRRGWDVRRVKGHPVASLILVCPACVAKERRRASPHRSLALGV
jgi:hypothetical protein